MNPKAVIEEILDTAGKLSLEKDRIKGIFQKSGVSVDGNGKVGGITGDPMAALKALMDNLSEMAVVKISAKQIIRKAGINL